MWWALKLIGLFFGEMWCHVTYDGGKKLNFDINQLIPFVF